MTEVKTKIGFRSAVIVPYLVAASFGPILLLCFPPIDFAALSWGALLPFAASLRAKANPPLLYGSMLVGVLIFYLAGLDWMRTSYDGVGLSGPRALSWLLLSEFESSCFLLGFWLCRVFARNCSAPMVIVLPITWVSLQVLCAGLCTLVNGMPFPWLQTGLPMITYERLAQVADLGGVWLVSLLVAAVNGALFDVIAEGLCCLSGRAHLSWWILRSPVYGDQALRHESPIEGPAALLMPNSLAPSVDVSVNGRNNGHVHVLGEEIADVLIWSEGAFEQPFVEVDEGQRSKDFWTLVGDNAIVDDRTLGTVEEIARSSGAGVFIGGSRLVCRSGQLEYFNCLAFFDPERGYIGSYDKQYPVPWSEYMPHLGTISMEQGLYGRGNMSPVFTIKKRSTGIEFRCSPAICYDAAHSKPFRDAITKNFLSPPQFFVVAARQDFEMTGRLEAFMLQATRYRAIECRRGIVRNVDGGGVSGLIGSDGRLMNMHNEVSEPILLAAVPIDSRISWYARFGDWVPYSCLVVLAMGLVRSERLHRLLGRPARV